MKKHLLLTMFYLAAALWAGAQQKPQDKFQEPEVFRKTIRKKVGCQYLLHLPPDYKSERAKQWPMILFLHGAGERGTNVWRADIHGPAKYIAAHPDFPFIVVTPLCPSNELWSPDTMLALLDDLPKKYRIDTNRIYLTGLSMGGFGTWEMALNYPERFAAAIPIAGGASDGMLILAAKGFQTPEKVAALRNLPIWAFHGGKDTVVPPEESQRLVNQLKKLGAEATLTIYPDATHNSWERTYNNPEIYEWLMQHRRH